MTLKGQKTDKMLQPQLDYYDMGKEVVAFTTTRGGGCSTGNYASFNINRYCGDTDDHISQNRKLLCDVLGIDDKNLIMPHQVHKTEIAVIDHAFLDMDSAKRQARLEGVDALMTSVKGVCIGVSTADCIPILLYDADHRAICAIHAGWRGTVARIVEKAVMAMKSTYGTEPERLKAQVGPGISLDSFEVGDEVYETFQQAGFDMTAISLRKKKWHINLPECNRLQLLDIGVTANSISMSKICTFNSPDRYFSARHLGINSGRLFTAIMLLAQC